MAGKRPRQRSRAETTDSWPRRQAGAPRPRRPGRTRMLDVQARVSKDTLRDLRVREDIIRAMHRAMTGAGHEPNVSSFALHDDDAADPVLGSVVAQGQGTKDVGRLDPCQ